MTSKTRSALSTEQATNFADNTTGAITPAILRSTVQDMIDSTGTLLDSNAWTGTAMSFTGSVAFSGNVTVGTTATTSTAIFAAPTTFQASVAYTSVAPAIFAGSVAFTNSTQSALFNGGVTSSVASIFTGGLIGSSTNDSATAGNIGEEIESIVAAASSLSLVSNTTKNITSISVTAGDWDISGNVSFQTSAATTITGAYASISSVASVLSVINGNLAGQFMATVTPGVSNTAIVIPIQPTRWSLSGTTTINLCALGVFGSTMSTYGIIRARRMR